MSGNISSGIEPIFAPAYERRFYVGDTRKTEIVYHPLFAKYIEEGKSTEHFVGSHELSVRDHLEVQKVVQKHIDSAISKTINIPEDYPVEEVSKLWLEYLPNVKGTTFYRENSRGFVDENGKVLEPPLKAIDTAEASNKLHKDIIKDTQQQQCRGGKCNL